MNILHDTRRSERGGAKTAERTAEDGGHEHDNDELREAAVVQAISAKS